MSTHAPSRRGSNRRRNVQMLKPMSEQPRPQGRTNPHDIFILWLMQLPDDVNKSAAARKEIARIEASHICNRDTEKLKDLFLDVVTAN